VCGHAYNSIFGIGFLVIGAITLLSVISPWQPAGNNRQLVVFFLGSGGFANFIRVMVQSCYAYACHLRHGFRVAEAVIATIRRDL
jgi:hypothetical protein